MLPRLHGSTSFRTYKAISRTHRRYNAYPLDRRRGLSTAAAAALNPAPGALETTLQMTHGLFEALHLFTGLPWAWTLICSAIVLRTAFVLPLNVYVRGIQRRRLDLQPLMGAWRYLKRDEALKSVGSKGPAAFQQRQITLMREKQRDVFKRFKCQTWKTFLPISQVPLFLMAIETVRRMCGTRDGLFGLVAKTAGEYLPSLPDFAHEETQRKLVEAGYGPDDDDDVSGLDSAVVDAVQTPSFVGIESSLGEEGFLWIPRLLEADPALILPFVVSAAVFTNLSLGGSSRKKPLTEGKALALRSQYKCDVEKLGKYGLSTRMKRRVQLRKAYRANLAAHGLRKHPLELFTTGLRISALFIGPLTLHLPSALLIYWIASSVTAIAQRLLLDRLMPLKRPDKS